MRVLITAGPTREFLDPVRFLSNPSSGAMGIEIANRFAASGAHVTLVLGPTHLRPSARVRTMPATTALDMRRAVLRYLSSADVFIATAAVSDWRFPKLRTKKMKKDRVKAISLRLVKNPDILAEAGRYKRRKKVGKPILVGFSLETNRAEKFAKGKLRKKNLDLVIANSPESFSSKYIKPVWIEKSGGYRRFRKMTKRELADRIKKWIFNKLPNN